MVVAELPGQGVRGDEEGAEVLAEERTLAQRVQALLHLLELTQGNVSPSVRKTLRCKSASLPLKLFSLSTLTSSFCHFESETRISSRIWCLDYASEPRFLAFLVNLVVVAPEVLTFGKWWSDIQPLLSES